MDPLKIVVLGSGSSIPTADRNHAGFWIRYGGKVFLWDCGEGTQRQLRSAGLTPTKIDDIFITHWHADHFAGLIGLLKTLKLEERTKELQLYGPQTEKYVPLILKLTGEPGYEIQTIELNLPENNLQEQSVSETQTVPQVVLRKKDFTISWIPARHSIPAVAYCFQEKDHWNIDLQKAKKQGLTPGPLLQKIKEQEKVSFRGRTISLAQIANKTKGRKIVYSGDTAPSPLIKSLATGADILVHEATFLKQSSLNHTTAVEAAKLAKSAGVKKLILTHYSQRFKTPEPLEKQAQKYFPNTKAARDLLKLEISR